MIQQEISMIVQELVLVFCLVEKGGNFLRKFDPFWGSLQIPIFFNRDRNKSLTLPQKLYVIYKRLLSVHNFHEKKMGGIARNRKINIFGGLEPTTFDFSNFS